MLLRPAMQIHFVCDSTLHCKKAKKKYSAYKNDITNVLWETGNVLDPRYHQYTSGAGITDIAAMIM